MFGREPIQATPEMLRELADLARSPQLFLSVYLPAEASETNTEGLQLAAASLLDGLEGDLEGAPWEALLGRERETVQQFLRALRPGGPGLALFSSEEAGAWSATWLPRSVSAHARFGHGVSALPLLDLLDELEPVGLAMVAKDHARLAVFSGGLLEEQRTTEGEVPGKHSSGGWSAARSQRHHLAHAEAHLRDAARELAALHRELPFRRLFLSGPPETVALFRPMLPTELERIVVGDLPIDAHAQPEEVRRRVVRAAEEAERAEERGLADELVTRGEKDQAAVLGVGPTAWALNRREVHRVLLAGEAHPEARYCVACDLLLPPEDVHCPQCGERCLRADLWAELPGFAGRREAGLEVVHDTAAAVLAEYGGVGALLRLPTHPH